MEALRGSADDGEETYSQIVTPISQRVDPIIWASTQMIQWWYWLRRSKDVFKNENLANY